MATAVSFFCFLQANVMMHDLEVIVIIRFGENSFAYKLIGVLVTVGECSYYSLNLFGYGNACRRKAMEMSNTCLYINTYTKEIVECKAISISGEGKMKKIRLRRDAYPLLNWMNELSDHIVKKIEGNMSGDKEHIVRHFRIAESTIMMQRAGIEIMQSKQTCLSIKDTDRSIPAYPCFYNSISIKRFISEENKKALYTRCIGLITYPGQVYPVYNIQNGTLNWSGQGELKAKTFLQILSSLCGGSNEINGAVVFGKSYNNALKSLYEAETSISKRRNSFIKTDYRLDLIYKSLFFVELNEQGARFLKTMTVLGWRGKLRGMFFDSAMLKNGAVHLGYDAVKNGKYICMFFDHDIAKLERFKNSNIMRTQKEDCQVFCYPEQVWFVKNYLGDDVTTKTIEFDKVYDRYFN